MIGRIEVCGDHAYMSLSGAQLNQHGYMLEPNRQYTVDYEKSSGATQLLVDFKPLPDSLRRIVAEAVARAAEK